MDGTPLFKISIFIENARNLALGYVEQACSSDNIQTSQLMIANAKNVDFMVGHVVDFHVRSCQATV